MTIRITTGDALTVLAREPDESIHCCFTSPPYWQLRDYGTTRQLGKENTPEKYITALCRVFDEVYRVLRNDGTLWVNLGDTYINKRLYAVPQAFTVEMLNHGWILRNTIIWQKPNGKPPHTQPEEYHRFVENYEPLMFFVKSEQHYFRIQKKKAQGGGYKMRRAVWPFATTANPGHPAPMPWRLAETAIRAGCPPLGTVLDPFCGTGTTGVACVWQDRSFFGIDLNRKYVRIAQNRIGRIPINR